MKMHHFILAVAAILPSTLVLAEGLHSHKRTPEQLALMQRNSRLTKGSEKTSMQLLNLWQTETQTKQDLYQHAFTFFEADPHATYVDLQKSPGFSELCANDNNRLLLGGPMLGQVASDRISVWVRTVRPSQVTIQLSVDGQPKTFGPVNSSEGTDLSAIVPITGLQPNTSYPYEVLVDGTPVESATQPTITTAPAIDSDDTTRIIFGSCFHRWGIGNPQQSATMLSRNPNAALFLGDIAVQDRNNHFGLHRTDYLLRDFAPAWNRLAANIPVYATWDDHDYFDNDKAGIPKGYTLSDKEGVWDVFRYSWNNPSYGLGEDGKGLFLRTRVGACDVIMVDNRYFREGKQGSFLGEQQMQWLEAQLLDCKGPFIIVSSGSMWSDYVSAGKDSWGKWDPQGRERIFSLIEKHKIGGVVFVSGDRHGARGFTIPRESGFQFYEFEAASLGERCGPPATQSNWDTQLFGFDGVYAFGEFTVDPAPSDPEITFRLVQQDGETLYSKTLTRSELTPR